MMDDTGNTKFFREEYAAVDSRFYRLLDVLNDYELNANSLQPVDKKLSCTNQSQHNCTLLLRTSDNRFQLKYPNENSIQGSWVFIENSTVIGFHPDHIEYQDMFLLFKIVFQNNYLLILQQIEEDSNLSNVVHVFADNMQVDTKLAPYQILQDFLQENENTKPNITIFLILGLVVVILGVLYFSLR